MWMCVNANYCVNHHLLSVHVNLSVKMTCCLCECVDVCVEYVM